MIDLSFQNQIFFKKCEIPGSIINNNLNTKNKLALFQIRSR